MNGDAIANIGGGAPFPKPALQPNSFDSLRLIGAVTVMVGHAFIITGTEAPMVGTIALHSLGVCIFFAISGFLITQSWLSDGNWQRYLQRRLLRILPALIIVATATALIIGACATTQTLREYFHHGWTWRYIVSNSVMVTVWGLPGVFDTLPIHGQANGSLWTLPIEFGLYLITPLLVTMHRYTGRAGAPLVVLIAAAVVLLNPTFPRVFSFNFLGIDIGKGLVLAPFFWLGSALRLIDFGAWSTGHRHMAFALSVAATIIWAWAASPALFLLGVIAISVLVLSVGLTDWLYSAVISRIGDLSYGTYLWAFPIQQLVMLKTGGGPVLNLAITAPITLTLAYLSWHLVERQALSFKPHRRARPKEEHRPVASDKSLPSPLA